MADGGNVIFKFEGDDSGLSKTMKSLGNIGKTALKGLVAGTGAVAAGFAGMVTASVKARGEFQQLEGGIESIFGGVEKGQAQINKVMELSKNAWQTLTMSSNDYLTNFMTTYPLMKADIEDQNEAIEKTNRIMKLNSDLANTFGYDMETASNAVNWALKGTFSYLDNLNIGIKGTKEGFLEAAQEAGYKVKKVADISKLSSSDILDILEKAADKYGVLGKTADEAATTMSGSIAMAKAAWENFLSGQGSLGEAISAADNALTNILTIVDQAMPDIMNEITENMPKILELGGRILTTLCDGIVEYMPQILDVVIIIIDKVSEALLQNSDKLGEISFKLMSVTAKGFMKAIPHILLAISDIIAAILLAITEANGKLWEAGFDLLMKFIDGVKANVGRVSQVVNQVKSIIKAVWGQLKHEAKQWGIDMLIGFAQGITERLGQLREHVMNVANSIRSMLHFSRPDTGPLRDYETWMPDMIKGMANSLDNAAPYLINKVNDLAGAMSISPTLNGNVNNNLSPNVNVIVNNQMEVDPLGQIVSQIKTFSNGAKNDYNYGIGG